MVKLLQSKAIVAALGVVLYLACTVVLMPPSKWVPPAVAAPSEAAPVPVVGPSWDYANPEVDQLVEELRKAKEAYETRQKQLDELEKRLQSERAEISQVTLTVSNLQRDIDQSLFRIKEEEAPNLKKLAKTYATMSAEGAATIFKEMQEDQIVRIIAFMKEDEKAAILEMMAKNGSTEAKRAANISERLRTTTARAATAKPVSP